MKKYRISFLMILITASLISGCNLAENNPKPRLSLFVGLDISGSFMNGEYYQDSIDFLAHYLYSHLNGLGGLEVPRVLFVSSIGGAAANEPKTFYPIQTFENKSIEEIRDKLLEIFPKEKPNPFTDYNSFFEQIALTVRNKNLVLRPVSVVMISDGIPDVIEKSTSDYKNIAVKPLEQLARSVTIRLLYTDAVVGKSWQTKVKRRRVKIWTQDANVMITWKDPKIFLPGIPIEKQFNFFSWIKDNVNFGVRSRRIG
jgi:hypothetical protein